MPDLSRVVVRSVLAVSLGLVVSVACHDDEPPENAGMACDVPSECYPDVEDEDLPVLGELVCLDRVPGGYCTHLCESDDDCCAVEGECKSDFPQVCAPFESTGMFMCFLSCEASDIDGEDEASFCQEYAHEAFGCRSTGGGSENRKVCVP
jgi:hypothetical protein